MLQNPDAGVIGLGTGERGQEWEGRCALDRQRDRADWRGATVRWERGRERVEGETISDGRACGGIREDLLGRNGDMEGNRVKQFNPGRIAFRTVRTGVWSLRRE